MQTTHGGLPIYHCVDWGEYARLADWPNAFLRRTFRAVLDEFRPAVVHFHNYLSLGDDLVSAAAACGAGVVYTLHDFGLICPNTLLLRDDRRLCDKAHADFFQDCCPTLIRTTGRDRHSAPWAARMPSLARWYLFSQQHPHPLLRALLLGGTGRVAHWLGDPTVTDVARKRDFFFTHTRRIFRDVDLFLAPSQFLLRRYVSCGVAPDKIVHAPYGMRRFAAPPRPEQQHRVRLGYIGALHPHKGIELLLEAFRGLGDRASLHVYGSVFGSPISQSYWRRIRENGDAAVVFHGAYDNGDVGAILAELDAVVVPSLWYENAPLTIQEAFIAGVPVITADTGGMAEMVRNGIDGLHFRLGDAADLHRTLRDVIEHPEVLDRLRRGVPPILGVEEHAAAVLARYREVVSRRERTSA